MAHAVDLSDLERQVIQRGGRRRAGGFCDVERRGFGGRKCSKLGCASLWTKEGEVAESNGDKRDMNKVVAEGVGVEGEYACESDINDSDDTAIGTEDDDEQ